MNTLRFVQLSPYTIVRLAVNGALGAIDKTILKVTEPSSAVTSWKWIKLKGTQKYQIKENHLNRTYIRFLIFLLIIVQL